MSAKNETADRCGCCEGVRVLTPAEHPNRPGLSALAYRVGTHGAFKATMEARISAMPALRELGTRENGDWTIALLDAWASVADVLTFYAERIANEGFLGTCTEFRSVQEHARSIGYEPRPGVAANTYLAFTVEDGPGAAESVPIPAGTRAQNVPDGDDLPQTFETVEDLVARPEWNAIRPRRSVPQLVNRNTRVFLFAGTDTGLSQGGWLLLLARESASPEGPAAIERIPLRIVSVEPDQETGRTRVETQRPQAPSNGNIGTPFGAAAAVAAPSLPPPPPPPSLFIESLRPSAASLSALAAGFQWSSGDTELFSAIHNFPPNLISKYANNRVVDPEPDIDTGVFAFRVETAPFGHNAPKYRTLPPAWITEGDDGGEETPPGFTSEVNDEKPYPIDWDAHPRQITQASDGTSHDDGRGVLLDAKFPEILANDWILLVSSTRTAAYRITRTRQVSRADFALSGQVTALTLEETPEDQPFLTEFFFRTTQIYARSERLALAERPVDDPVQGDTIELDRKLDGIRPGQHVVVSGTPQGLSDEVVESELAIVKDSVSQGRTTLLFEKKLKRTYRRDTVRLNTNVARATHGEIRQEDLGFGDASRPFQSFQLGHEPLTHVSAPVAGGSRSTLELRVNDLLWRETEHFFGLEPNARRYVVRRDEEKASIVFGDGNTGQAPPTGSEISAKYRSGIGAGGNLPTGKISLLGSQPRWVRSVVNPVAADGGADPESTTDARKNAPNSVRTFGRIVSLRDFEDFAQSFAGVSKAKADLLHLGEGHLVHVTVAGESGAPVPTDSDQHRDLVEAMNRVRDPSRPLIVASYQKRFFDVAAKARVHADYQTGPVLEAVEKALRETFSFQRRELGQDVTLSEVVAVMQRVGGVEAVDVDVLRFSHERYALAKALGFGRVPLRLPALPARRGAGGKLSAAQHLAIFGVRLTEMP